MPDNKSRDELEREFFETLTKYFSERWWPTGFFNTVGGIKTQLEKLNSNLEASSQASDRLTGALHRITLWGVIVAGLGVAVAATTLGFEIYKYAKEPKVVTPKPNPSLNTEPQKRPG